MRVGSVYGGVGSCLIGAKLAGFDLVYLEDPREWVNPQTVSYNFPGLFFSNRIGANTGVPVDLIIGQPPCKIFSKLAMRKKDRFNFDIADLEIYKFLEKVNEISPDYFILENLPNILNFINFKNNYFIEFYNKYTNEWNYIETPKYKFHIHILNSRDYGVCQNRKRLFVIGTKSNDFKYKKPDLIEPLTLKETIDGLIENMNEVKNQELPNHTQERIEGFKKLECGESYYGTQNNKKLFPNTVAPVITSHRTHYLHYSEPRILTVRERARVMGFPDDFIFFGGQTERYDQTGCSIVPKIIESICKQILEYEKDKDRNKKRNS